MYYHRCVHARWSICPSPLPHLLLDPSPAVPGSPGTCVLIPTEYERVPPLVPGEAWACMRSPSLLCWGYDSCVCFFHLDHWDSVLLTFLVIIQSGQNFALLLPYARKVVE